MATLPDATNPTNWGTTYNTWLQVEHDSGGLHTLIKDPLYDVRAYGAVGDGATLDTVALDAASTASPLLAAVSKAAGNYMHGDTAVTLSGNFSGTGVLETTDGARGNNVRRLLSAPSVLSNGNSVVDFWGNDFSFIDNYDIAVTGASTIGTPAAGYVQYDQVHPYFYGAYFSSGHNDSLTDATGRTGWAIQRMRLQQAGDGDAFCLNMNCVVSNTSSATHTGLFGSVAGGLWNGNITAAADQVYLNPVEYNIQSSTFDVRAVGLVINMDRDENAAARDEWWAGCRMQSTGDDPADAAYQASGAWNVGLDFTPATANNAIALKAGQLIHFDATATTVGGASTYATTFNGTKIGTSGGLLKIWHTTTEQMSFDGDIVDVSTKFTTKSLATEVESRTTTKSLTATDSVILVDATGTAPVYTLPDPAAYAAANDKGGEITIKRTGAGTGTCEIEHAGGDYIIDQDGTDVTSFFLDPNAVVKLMGDGTDTWHIMYMTNTTSRSDGLLSVTAIADISSEVETTIYTVPTSKTLLLTKAILKVAGDAGANGVCTIGADATPTDFVGTTNMDNLDAAGDAIMIAPIPSATPATLKEYAAATVIKYDQATAGAAVAGTLYLYGTLDDA